MRMLLGVSLKELLKKLDINIYPYYKNLDKEILLELEDDLGQINELTVGNDIKITENKIILNNK